MGDDGRRRFGAKRIAAMLCALVALLAVCSTRIADAQESPIAKRAGLKVLDLVVDQELMEKTGDRLTISEEQRLQMQRLFAEYWKEILTIDAQGHQRALVAGLRDAEAMFAADRESMSQKMERMRQDYRAFDAAQQQRAVELHNLRVVYMPHIRAAQRLADGALTLWEQRLIEMGIVDDTAGETLLRRIRAANFDDGGSRSSDDFHKAANVLDLIEAGSQSGGELESRRGSSSFEKALGEIVEDYESRVDRWVLAEMAAARAPIRRRDVPRSLSSVHDPEAFEAAQRAACDRWRKRFFASHDAVESISLLLDESTRCAWRDRYLRAIAPELMQPRLPDALLSWLTRRTDAAPDQIQSVQELSHQWRDTRDALRARIVQSALDAKSEVEFLRLAPETCPSVRRYATELYRLHQAALMNTLNFESILTPDQRAEFQTAFPALRVRAADGTFGPPMDPGLMRKVTPPINISTTQ